MLWFSIGLPGRFSEWCDEIVACLAGSSGNCTVLERKPSIEAMLAFEPLPPLLDELTRLAMRSDATAIVIGARQPDHGLYRALAETQASFVLAFDQPRLAVADLTQDPGADALMATRAIANSCALLMRYSSLPGALILHGETARRDPSGTALTIARHLGIEISLDAIPGIVGGHGSAGGGDSVERIPPAAAKTVGGALSGYEEYLRGLGLGRLVWNRDLFLVSGAQRRANEVLDVAGGARPLIYGPYIHLPPGSWSARLHLGLSENAAKYPLLVEVYSGERQAAVTLQPNVAGIHIAELNFSLGEASPPVEVRGTVLSPEAEGRFALGYMVLTPAGLPHPQAGNEWQQEFEAASDL